MVLVLATYKTSSFGNSSFKDMPMDNLMNSLIPLLFMSAPLLPFLVIYGVGASICLFRWQRHPTPSRLAFVAFALFSLRLFTSVVKNWLLLRGNDFGWDAQALGLRLGILTVLDLVIAIVAWILLLIALFARYDAAVPNVGQNYAAKD